MNMFVFSPSKNLIFPTQLQDNYVTAGTWPDDVTSISDEMGLQFINPAPLGKVRIVGKDGLPCWGDIPPPTRDELIAAAEEEKQFRLHEADTTIERLRDAVELDMATNEESALYTAWRKYRVLLNRIDTSKAPGVEWPTQPA